MSTENERQTFEAHFGPFSWDESDFEAEQAGWKARAALAQPSPAQVYACPECGTGMQVDPSAKPSKAQPSPAPDLERPEAIEFDWPEYHAQGMGCGLEDRGITNRYDAMQHGWDCAIDRCAEIVPDEPLMTVAQHDRIVGALRAEVARLDDGWKVANGIALLNAQERDATLAWAAELVVALERAATAMWNSEANMDNAAAEAEEAIGNAKSAAPVAQAGQVPDDVEAFLDEVRAELLRARSKFPGDRIMTIALAEEFGELCKAVLDEPAANVRKEAVQTAVMAARVVLDGDGSVTAWRAERGLDQLAAAPKPVKGE